MSKLGLDCAGAQYRVAGFIVIELKFSAHCSGDDDGGCGSDGCGGGGGNDGGGEDGGG